MVEQQCRVAYGTHGVVAGPAQACGDLFTIDVRFDGAENAIATGTSLLSLQTPTMKLSTGFQVGDVVFYLGKTTTWPSGDKVSVGARGTAKGPGEGDMTQISVLFQGNRQAVSLPPGQIMPACPDWVPHSIEGMPGGA